MAPVVVEAPLPAAAEMQPPTLPGVMHALLTGELDANDQASPGYALPRNAAEIEAAAGGLDRLISECLVLLRLDYPIFALRRLVCHAR